MKKTKQNYDERFGDGRSTKRYIKRVVEQQEAEKEIEDYTDGSDSNRLDGVGFDDGECGEGKF